jgi:hypothetical protein
MDSYTMQQPTTALQGTGAPFAISSTVKCRARVAFTPVVGTRVPNAGQRVPRDPLGVS